MVHSKWAWNQGQGLSGPFLGDASSETHPTSIIPTWLLPQQQVKLSSHAFFSLTEADGHCSAALHSSVRLPEQLLGCHYIQHADGNSLLASKQDCMQTVPERKPSTIFLKISKYRNSTPLWCLISLPCNLNLFWYYSSSLSLGLFAKGIIEAAQFIKFLSHALMTATGLLKSSFNLVLEAYFPNL